MASEIILPASAYCTCEHLKYKHYQKTAGITCSFCRCGIEWRDKP
jgi:hypothetical protein